ncbi:helix-turn-helix domain-containing protein [Haloarculaceae archaeon H-GB2-1]|nr:helix-turn-helix domain-containing protein [Haloarculaceae archaeon H-GB1-1]MEA5386897.1 helix-turn-helix domain-containing protein [Haloarculaceae archaeon H-GB11]MEA5408378.1 helix-turn-helix domain-containing protein [Haloarculaceae archaeon H-GB2-1]
MSTGIRAAVKFDGLEGCPVATVSQTGERVDSISRATNPNGDGMVAEEFTVDRETTIDADVEGDMTRVFSYEDGDVYRFTRELGNGCVCDHVESYDCSVQDIYAEDGALVVTFFAADIETLREIMRDLRDEYGSLSMQSLSRSGETEGERPVFVDWSSLTSRQHEILETAYEMGYFEYPKTANAGDVADALGIARSTFVEHLSTAQSKVLGNVVET